MDTVIYKTDSGFTSFRWLGTEKSKMLEQETSVVRYDQKDEDGCHGEETNPCVYHAFM